MGEGELSQQGWRVNCVAYDADAIRAVLRVKRGGKHNAVDNLVVERAPIVQPAVHMEAAVAQGQSARETKGLDGLIADGTWKRHLESRKHLYDAHCTGDLARQLACVLR